MPYTDSGGVRIHYHVQGDGPPLVLQHGLTSSIKNWYAHGYVEGLQGRYRLVLVDARGHGESDKPHDPESYDMKLMALDVIAVLDHLGVDKAHYQGYSMGGRIGFNIAKYAPERVESLVLGGMHPFKLDFGPSDEFVKALEQGMEAHVARMEALSGPVDPEHKARVLANDPKAIIGAWTGLGASPGTEDVLPRMTMPCLVYVGEADTFYEGAKECVNLMPNVAFVSFPGLDHGQVSQSSAVVLPHVLGFLESAVV